MAAVRPRPLQRGATEQYQRAQVESASPTRLVVLLYDGAIRFCRLAQEAMRKRDLETQNTNLVRAQRIVGELLASLNRGAGGEVATNLSNIYGHILEELVQANLYDKPEKLDHVLALLTEMRASWVEIDRLATGDGPMVDAPGTTAKGADRSSQPAAVPTAPRAARASSGMARLIAEQNRSEERATATRLGDRLV